MEIMRKFIIDLKSDGTMKWAEVCDEPTPEARAYKRIINYCEIMEYLEDGKNADKIAAYQNVIFMCKRLGSLR